MEGTAGFLRSYSERPVQGGEFANARIGGSPEGRPGDNRARKVLVPFGFTERQARFLATVMLHSGVFVGRQYAAFAGITHGQKVHDFIDKLLIRKLVTRSSLERPDGRGSSTFITSRSTQPSASRITGIAGELRSTGRSSA